MLAQQAPLPGEGARLPAPPVEDTTRLNSAEPVSRTRLMQRLGESRRGTTWSGRLEDGTLVAAKRLKSTVTAPDVNDLARVANVDRSHLVPVRSVVEERNEQWMISELADGLPLRELLRRGRPSTMCAVAIAMDVLDGLAELHRAGLWHGAVHAGNVHVGADGTVRLSDYGLSVRGASNESALRFADVNGVGVLLCGLLHIANEAEGAVEGGGAVRRPSKRSIAMATSPLGLAARRMVKTARNRPAAGYEAVQARLALWEAAGRLANRRIHGEAKRRLAEMVAEAPALRSRPGAKVPSRQRRPAPVAASLARPLDVVAASQVHPEPGDVVVPRPDGSPLQLMLALVVIAALAGLAMALTGPQAGGRVSPAVATGRCSICSPDPLGIIPPSPKLPDRDGREGAGVPLVATPRGQPVEPAPELAPQAVVTAPPRAGVIERVLGILGGCDPQGSCLLHVEVWLVPSPVARPVSWEVRSLAPCTRSSVQLATGYVLAQRGWNHVAADTALRLTGARAEALVVITQQPDQAATPLIAAGTPGPC